MARCSESVDSWTLLEEKFEADHSPFPLPYNSLKPPFYKNTLNCPNEVAGAATSVNSHGVEQQTLEPLLPAACREGYEIFKITTADDLLGFLERELSVERLNRIHDCLWLAGRPMPPRPLNYQVSVGRSIVADENMDMHLVWEKSRKLHLKPIPRYLLDYKFWEQHLVCTIGLDSQQCPEDSNDDPQMQSICRRRELYKYALGFLISYTALIQYESDFQVARDHHLLPAKISWELWVKFCGELLSRPNMQDINKRYLFGELRLSRLNKIYRIRVGHMLQGYSFPYQTYSEMFQEYLAPIAATTIYIALALTAMQVGLATDELNHRLSFENTSYVFAVFCILAPLILLVSITLIGILLFISNVLVTLKIKNERFKEYERMTAGNHIT